MSYNDCEIKKESIDWVSLSSAEIYDRLAKKGAKLGIQTNKMIRKLKEKGYLPANYLNKLRKTNAEKRRQREHFNDLPPEGLELLRQGMKFYFDSDGNNTEDPENALEEGDISKTFRAQVWHLADDSHAAGYLEAIFGGVDKGDRRAQVDNKAQRMENNWKDL